MILTITWETQQEYKKRVHPFVRTHPLICNHLPAITAKEYLALHAHRSTSTFRFGNNQLISLAVDIDNLNALIILQMLA